MLGNVAKRLLNAVKVDLLGGKYSVFGEFGYLPHKERVVRKQIENMRSRAEQVLAGGVVSRFTISLSQTLTISSPNVQQAPAPKGMLDVTKVFRENPEAARRALTQGIYSDQLKSALVHTGKELSLGANIAQGAQFFLPKNQVENLIKGTAVFARPGAESQSATYVNMQKTLSLNVT